MDNATITELDNGLLAIKANEGYVLYNDFTGNRHSEVEAKSIIGWRAVLSGITPTPHTRTLDDAKKERIAALMAYDASEAVNSFIFGGRSMWIAPADRANYMLTLEGAKRQGLSSVSFLGQEIPVDNAIGMIDAVNLYAMQCVAVTDAHKAAIYSKRTIKSVDNYVFTSGYPDKISF